MTAPYSTTRLTVKAVTFATYAAPPVSGLALDRWQADAVQGEIRRSNVVHDAATALFQVEVSGDLGPADVSGLLSRVRNGHGLPAEHRLGRTAVVMIQTDDPDAGRDLVRHLFGGPRYDGGDWPGVGKVYAGDDPELLVLLTEAGDEADRRMSRILYETIRVGEMYRHKVDGQFALYEADYRTPLLDAVIGLEAQLHRVAKLAGTPPTPDTDPLADAGRGVTAAYCTASLVYAPVREVQAMLAANLTNLRAVLDHAAAGTDGPGLQILRRRADRAALRRAQVDADLGRADPVFDAARWVGQFHHGQLLAQMTATEVMENKQREQDATARERQTSRLTLIALWLGVSQVWAAWIALWPDAGRPDNLWYLLVLCFLPTVGGGLLLIARSLLHRPTTNRVAS